MDTTWEDYDNQFEDDADNTADFEHLIPKGEHRIGIGTFGLMMGTAIFFDFLQISVTFLVGLIPLVGTFSAPIISFFIGFFGWLTFFMWFTIKGVSFMFGHGASKKIVQKITLGFIELVPFLGAIVPGLSITVFIMCRDARKEDRKQT